MTNISQLKVNSSSIGSGTWIAHTPTNQDYFTFENPAANYQPFGVGSGYLDIRVQQDGNDPNDWFGGFSGGLLSSMDSSGAGFAQKYGYFECSMQTPGTPNTWPAFWLLSAPNITNSSLPYLAEIDVHESYGNYGTGPNQSPPGNPNTYSVAWHNWGENGNTTTQAGLFTQESGLTTSYHTYGVDIEPTGISWYFDRQLVWQAPIFAAAEQPMLVMVNLALGGGDYNNSTNTGYNWALTPDPTDLKVQYVAVWASPNSPNYSGSGGSAPGSPSGLTATGGNAQVALSWSAASGATSYTILRGTSSGGETALATGVTATSYTDSTVTNGTSYYYEVAAVNSSGTSGNSNEASATPSGGGGGGGLPSPWMAQDVGETWATGSTTYSGGTFTLNGAGNGAYYTPDGLQYAYQTVNGDCSIVARVVTQADSAEYAGAGVMIRDGLAEDSGFADMIFQPGGGAYFQYRPDGTDDPDGTGGTGTAPYWVKITRVGNTFTGYVSPNGSSWTQVGSTTLSMPSAAYIGLTQASGVGGQLATATFDNVTVIGGSGGSAPAAPTGLSASGGNAQVSLSWTASTGATSYSIYRGTTSGGETALASGVTATSYTDSSVTNGTTYYYKVAAVNGSGASGESNEASATPSGGGGSGGLPSPWLAQDVGETWATGSTTYSSGTFTLNGAGNGAYYTPDGLQFAYQTVTGDCSIVARVVTQADSAQYAGAGVMIRDGLAEDSGFADMILQPGGVACFQYRPDSGDPNGTEGSGEAPYWVKITRSGNTFTGYVSPNGSSWTEVGSTTQTMPTTVYLDLAQASGVGGQLATSTFDNVTVTP